MITLLMNASLPGWHLCKFNTEALQRCRRHCSGTGCGLRDWADISRQSRLWDVMEQQSPVIYFLGTSPGRY
jgi:hypothetical protein